MHDFYVQHLVPYGSILTDMEREGILVRARCGGGGDCVAGLARCARAPVWWRLSGTVEPCVQLQPAPRVWSVGCRAPSHPCVNT
jgi:hypothetical protein